MMHVVKCWGLWFRPLIGWCKSNSRTVKLPSIFPWAPLNSNGAQENAFESVICKVAAILCRPQRLKYILNIGRCCRYWYRRFLNYFQVLEHGPISLKEGDPHVDVELVANLPPAHMCQASHASWQECSVHIEVVVTSEDKYECTGIFAGDFVPQVRLGGRYMHLDSFFPGYGITVIKIKRS